MIVVLALVTLDDHPHPYDLLDLVADLSIPVSGANGRFGGRILRHGVRHGVRHGGVRTMLSEPFRFCSYMWPVICDTLSEGRSWAQQAGTRTTYVLCTTTGLRAWSPQTARQRGREAATQAEAEAEAPVPAVGRRTATVEGPSRHLLEAHQSTSGQRRRRLPSLVLCLYVQLPSPARRII